MAEALVFELATKLVKYAKEEIEFLEAVRGQVNELKEELEWIKSFLKEADFKAKKDERTKFLVKEIRQLCFKAEDVVDEFVYSEVMRSRQSKGGKFWSNLFKSCAFFIEELIARHRASDQIKDITTRLHKLAERRSTYGITGSGEGIGESKAHQWQRPSVSSFDDTVRVVGFQRHVDSIVERLIVDRSRRRSVMSIVGIGGLGKTTLAWKVFNSPEVVKEFSFRTWVTVSKEYDGVMLLKKILEKMEGSVEAEEVLNARIREYLRDKRYLIILDDVWEDEVWNHIKEALPDRKNGSWVVMTTRFKSVAVSADREVEPYELGLLNHEDSLELLLQRASPNEEDPVKNCPEELRPVAEQLLERCGRLPLALEVLGGRLCNEDVELHSWLKVLKTLSWHNGANNEEKCMSILASSYWDLPEHLKPCFLYLAGFPLDRHDYGKVITRLWVAEGFVEDDAKGMSTMEEKAEEYLEELIQRSMVQVIERDHSDGGVISCRVHDLLREFAVTEAEEIGFLKNIRDTADAVITTDTRRMILQASTFREVSINLRTLLFRAISSPGPLRVTITSSYKFLRVLDIKLLYREIILEDIAAMINLRYLRIRGASKIHLPPSICDLQFLETIDISWFFTIFTHSLPIPDAFWKIPTLRHVCFTGATDPVHLPPESEAKLSRLQTLECMFDSGNMPAKRRLPSLRKLSFKLTNVTELSSAGAVFLAGLPQLLSLECIILKNDFYFPTKEFAFHDQLQSLGIDAGWRTPLKEYEFPPRLTKLVLSNSQFATDPMEELEKLPKLRHLELKTRSYMGKEMVCSAGGFPQLRYLMLLYLNNLKRFKVQASAMAKLQHLRIRYCENLKVHPDFQHLTSLNVLWWIDSKLDLEEDKVKHIPSVTFHKL